MPIPVRRVDISLSRATPSALTPEKLRKQLKAIGLDCDETKIGALTDHIRAVKNELKGGGTQVFFIGEPDAGVDPETDLWVASALGNWEPGPTAAGYSRRLIYICEASHFTWLMRNRSGFPGKVNNPPAHTGKYDNVEGIKKLYRNVALEASATVVNEIDKDALEAMLSNAIRPLEDTQLANYDSGWGSLAVGLVDDYNPDTEQAAGVGWLIVEWRLQVKDYKEKKKNPQHDTRLEVKCRCVLYDDADALKADEAAARAHFGDTGPLFGAIPVPKKKVHIFPKRPEASPETWDLGLPTRPGSGEYVDVVILYMPDIQNVGAIDNTQSKAATTWSKSVTTGFTVGVSTTLSEESYFEASAEVVKAGVRVGISVTFTAQYNQSTTETMSFTVPAGERAFTYQGYIMAQVLRYTPNGDRFDWVGGAGRFLTNVLTTSATALIDPTS